MRKNKTSVIYKFYLELNAWTEMSQSAFAWPVADFVASVIRAIRLWRLWGNWRVSSLFDIFDHSPAEVVKSFDCANRPIATISVSITTRECPWKDTVHPRADIFHRLQKVLSSFEDAVIKDSVWNFRSIEIFRALEFCFWRPELFIIRADVERLQETSKFELLLICKIIKQYV